MSDIADGTSAVGWDKTREIADRVEAFVRDVVIPYEKNPRRDHHDATAGPGRRHAGGELIGRGRRGSAQGGA